MLLIKGRPTVNDLTARTLLQCFSHAIVDADGARCRCGRAEQRAVRRAHDGGGGRPRSSAARLRRWAGRWTTRCVKSSGRAAVPQDVQVVLELINGVDREEPRGAPGRRAEEGPDAGLPPDALPELAGVRPVGRDQFLRPRADDAGLCPKLKRWLALLLASSSQGRQRQAGDVRRGAPRPADGRAGALGHGDAEMRGEMFICGVFSLLDRMLKQPFRGSLQQRAGARARAPGAAEATDGPFQPYLELVRAIEPESMFDMRDAARSSS